MGIDATVQAELARVGASLLVDAIERRRGKRLAELSDAEKLEAIREFEAARTFKPTDEILGPQPSAVKNPELAGTPDDAA